MHWLPAILILPYFLILLKIYRNLLKIKPFFLTGEPATFVSLIIACRNEEEHLPELLRDISEQDYPSALFEIILVDDNSTDRTVEVASRDKGSFNILIINNNGKGKKQAIRTGIGSAAGILIVTTDADCRMGKNWLRTIAAFYEKHKPDMIICPVQIESTPGLFGRFQELEFLSLQGITAGSAYADNGTMCNGANLAFTREAYLKNAGNLNFGIPSGDDVFFLHSLKKQKGSAILWLESRLATVTTESSPGVISYLKQRRRWISKSKAYSDKFAILLGIVTFITIFLQLSLLFAVIINQVFIPVFLTVLLIKSVPDFLILFNTSSRYGRVDLMKWFLPVQLLYPFYVLAVVLYALILPERKEY
jgi:cellulose synthase/poly-beta-1,6-N-acetylglucosamine synthase-like glycosyltransferase